MMKNFKRGTPGFGLFLGALFVLAGGLVMWIGFWRTLLLVLLFAVGYFLGAVENKKEALKNTVNRLIPEKKEEVIDFRRRKSTGPGCIRAGTGTAVSAEADGDTDEEE